MRIRLNIFKRTDVEMTSSGEGCIQSPGKTHQ